MRRRGFVKQVIVSLKLSDNQENMTGEKGHEAGHQYELDASLRAIF